MGLDDLLIIFEVSCGVSFFFPRRLFMWAPKPFGANLPERGGERLPRKKSSLSHSDSFALDLAEPATP
jgi:hypothetical protein